MGFVFSSPPTSLRRMQCTITMMKPSSESNTAKRIWKRAERRSVMARTADIQVRARRGSTTQELHRDALQVTDRERRDMSTPWTSSLAPEERACYWITCSDKSPMRLLMEVRAYPALSFSFTSVMPSLDTSLLKTRIPMTMFTCWTRWDGY